MNRTDPRLQQGLCRKRGDPFHNTAVCHQDLGGTEADDTNDSALDETVLLSRPEQPFLSSSVHTQQSPARQSLTAEEGRSWRQTLEILICIQSLG